MQHTLLHQCINTSIKQKQERLTNTEENLANGFRDASQKRIQSILHYAETYSEYAGITNNDNEVYEQVASIQNDSDIHQKTLNILRKNTQLNINVVMLIVKLTVEAKEYSFFPQLEKEFDRIEFTGNIGSDHLLLFLQILNAVPKQYKNLFDSKYIHEMIRNFDLSQYDQNTVDTFLEEVINLAYGSGDLDNWGGVIQRKIEETYPQMSASKMAQYFQYLKKYRSYHSSPFLMTSLIKQSRNIYNFSGEDFGNIFESIGAYNSRMVSDGQIRPLYNKLFKINPSLNQEDISKLCFIAYRRNPKTMNRQFFPFMTQKIQETAGDFNGQNITRCIESLQNMNDTNISKEYINAIGEKISQEDTHINNRELVRCMTGISGLTPQVVSSEFIEKLFKSYRPNNPKSSFQICKILEGLYNFQSFSYVQKSIQKLFKEIEALFHDQQDINIRKVRQIYALYKKTMPLYIQGIYHEKRQNYNRQKKISSQERKLLDSIKYHLPKNTVETNVIRYGFELDFVVRIGEKIINIELDGKHHADIINSDKRRDEILRSNGIEVYRIQGNQNFDGAISTLLQQLSEKSQ